MNDSLDRPESRQCARTPNRRAEGLWRGGEIALGVLAIALVALLAVQNHGLKTRNAALTALLYEQASPRPVQAGDYLMELRFRSLDGRELRRSFLRDFEAGQGRDLTLVLLDPACAACQSEVARWNELARRNPWTGDVVAVSSGSAAATNAFVQQFSVEFPVYLGGKALAEQLRAPGFPTLIRVSPGGRIQEVVIGATNEESGDCSGIGGGLDASCGGEKLL